MIRRILLLQGHPDGRRAHFGHALADAYAEGAAGGGHGLKSLRVSDLDFPLLRSAADWNDGPVPPALVPAQEAILWAEHLVLFFPLWMGDMPALLKGFLEQVGRPGFAFRREGGNPFAGRALAGRSARVVVTMGMPALVYRFYYRAHSLKSLERNILGFMGIGPIDESLVGQVEALGEAGSARWLDRMRALGREAA